MLVLSRKAGEGIIINGDIRVVFIEMRRDKARIGIEAPDNVRIDREEIVERIAAGEPDRKKPGFTGLDMANFPLSEEQEAEETAERTDATCVGSEDAPECPHHMQGCFGTQPGGVDCIRMEAIGFTLEQDLKTDSEFRTIMAEAEGPDVMAAAGLVDEVPTVDVGAVLQEIANCRNTIYNQVSDYVCGAAVRNELRKMELLMAELAGVQL